MPAISFQQYNAPAFGGVTITPSDSAILTTKSGRPFRGLYVGTTGNVAVRFLDGSVVDFVAVPGGTTLKIQVDKVLETGTTANDLLGLF